VLDLLPLMLLLISVSSFGDLPIQQVNDFCLVSNFFATEEGRNVSMHVFLSVRQISQTVTCGF